jgi:hypothetical protein
VGRDEVWRSNVLRARNALGKRKGQTYVFLGHIGELVVKSGMEEGWDFSVVKEAFFWADGRLRALRGVGWAMDDQLACVRTIGARWETTDWSFLLNAAIEQREKDLVQVN